MLSIFGSKGDNATFWCVLATPGFNPSGASIEISKTFGPITVKLPPSDGREYDTATSGYGISGESIYQGYLDSLKGNKHKPNPCVHLNNIGTILCLDGTGKAPILPLFAGWQPIVLSAKSFFQHSVSAAEVVQYSGYTTPTGQLRFYNRYGSIVSISDINYYYPRRLGWVPDLNPSDGLRKSFQYGRLLYITKPPYAFSDSWLEYKYTPTLTDVEVLLFNKKYRVKVINEDGWYCSVAKGTVTPSYGGYETLNRQIRLTKIRGNTIGTFDFYMEYSGTTSRYYIDAYGTKSVPTVTTISGGQWMPIYIISPTHVVDQSLDLSDLEEDLYNYCKISRSEYRTHHADIARNNAVADIDKLESNNIENVAGLKGSFSIFGDLVKGYRAFRSGDIKGALRALGGVYLYYKYAIAPTIADVKDNKSNTGRLVNNVLAHRFSNERRRGRYVNPDISLTVGKQTYACEYHTRLRDKCYATLWYALEKFGLQVDVSQIWDLVPFSFVIDWFLHVGPILTTIDSYNSMCLTRDVLFRIESYKTSKVEDAKILAPTSKIFIVGPYTSQYYDRRIYSGPGRVDPLAGQNLATGLSSSQMTQGIALITQQLR